MDNRYLKSDTALGDVTKNLGAMVFRNRDAFGESHAFAEKEDGRYRYWSWNEFASDVLAFSSFLSKAGMKKGDAIAVIGGNSYRRLVAEIAVMASGRISVPLFIGYGYELTTELLEFSDVKMLLTDNPAKAGCLKDEDVPVCFLGDASSGKGAISFDDVISARASTASELKAEEDLLRSIDPTDVMLIMYTSGTASFPKGVMLTHRNILTQQGALEILWKPKPGMRFLCYLPWHHSFGGLFERFFAMHSGGCLAVDDSLGKNVDLLLENFSVIKPHIYFSVPKIYQEIVSRAIVQPRVREDFFHSDLKFVFTAAAPLPLSTSDVFAANNVLVVEGWGLTETSPCCTLTGLLLGRKPGVVGFPIPGVEVKLGDEDEILVRGPNVMVGYYKQPEKTNEVIDSEGWFSTGDIGEITAGGVKIVSRKDRIFKLSKGEKVYPARIEGEITTICRLIKHAYVFGSGRDRPYALIFPNYELLKSARENVSDDSGCVNPGSLGSLADCFRKCLKKINDRIPLKYERICQAVIVDHELTLEKNELTPSFKLIPRRVEENYREYIDCAMRGAAREMPKDAYVVEV